jgi:NADPH-dependent ferric siderophore reductase
MHDEQQKGQQMNSSQPNEGQSAKQIPAFRPYLVKVARTEQLSTSFRRLVFTGDDLQYIGTDGLDQRIKILLPLEGGRWGDPHLFAPDSVEQGSWWETVAGIGTSRPQSDTHLHHSLSGLRTPRAVR